jgi:DNA-directed RNA polymerase subunit E'/Rpb7
MYHKNTVQDKIYLHPRFLQTNLDEAIVSAIQKKTEGICTKDGYVRKKSISLLKRSIGIASGNDTNGYVCFDVLYSVEICNPMNGDYYPCVVKMTNKIGFEAEPLSTDKPSPLIMIVMKEHVENKALMNIIQKGDYVLVRVIGSNFDLGDDKIKLVGVLVDKLTPEQIPASIMPLPLAPAAK